MPPFSPANTIHKADDTSMDLNSLRRRMNDSSSNDSQDVPFKPLVLELSSASSFSTLATAGSSSTSSSSLSSFASSPSASSPSASSSFTQSNNNNNHTKMKRNVSFREDADIRTVEPVHHPQDISDRWYSKRELHIIRHKIRSLLRWVNMRNQHFFQYEQQHEVEYYDDDSQERYLRSVPPPPQPPCVTFYDECLFGLEKHLFDEKNQVRETKYNAQSVVFSEQQLQKQLGQRDHDRLAFQYSQTSAASQQEAIWIAQINAQESELYGQELQAQQRFEEEQRLQIQQLEQARELELRKIESLETAFLQEPHDAHQHLFLLERPQANKNNKNTPLLFGILFQNWRACFGKLFRPHQDCEIDSEEDCLNAPPRQPQRHPCLNVPQQEQQQDYYYR